MEMENLKALVYGHDLSAYQKILAQKEFETMQKAALNIAAVVPSLSTIDEIIKLKEWINDGDVFNWYSDGYETFELYAEKLINKGINVEFIKMMLSGLYYAVSNEFGN